MKENKFVTKFHLKLQRIQNDFKIDIHIVKHVNTKKVILLAIRINYIDILLICV